MQKGKRLVSILSITIFTLSIIMVAVIRMQFEKASLSEGWYILPTSEYIHYDDPVKDVVGKWLQGKPERQSYMELFEKSSYSFDEWVAKGRKIDHLEDTLIGFYLDSNSDISKYSVLDALIEVGTTKSVGPLINSFRKDELSDDQKEIIAFMSPL